jgi:hypothetical protein
LEAIFVEEKKLSRPVIANSENINSENQNN